MKILLLVTAFFVSFSSFANEFEMLKMRLSGCYEGVDNYGNYISGKVTYIKNPIGTDFLTLAINGKAASYLEIRFYIPNKNQSIVTQVMEDGKILNTEILNNTINYSQEAILEKYLSGQLLGSFENKSLMAIKFNGSKIEFNIYQNDNSEFLYEFYNGHKKSGILKIETRSVNCNN